jgi:hypothetical protein
VNVGDQVRVKAQSPELQTLHNFWFKSKPGWIGLVLEFKDGLARVYWNEDFPNEGEYIDHLEVVNETR